MRGMAAALLNTERRWSGVREDDLALVQAALATPMLPEPRAAQQDRRPDASVLAHIRTAAIHCHPFGPRLWAFDRANRNDRSESIFFR